MLLDARGGKTVSAIMDPQPKEKKKFAGRGSENEELSLFLPPRRSAPWAKAGATSPVDFASVAARLKPCPDESRSYLMASEAARESKPN